MINWVKVGIIIFNESFLVTYSCLSNVDVLSLKRKLEVKWKDATKRRKLLGVVWRFAPHFLKKVGKAKLYHPLFSFERRFLLLSISSKKMEKPNFFIRFFLERRFLQRSKFLNSWKNSPQIKRCFVFRFVLASFDGKRIKLFKKLEKQNVFIRVWLT